MSKKLRNTALALVITDSMAICAPVASAGETAGEPIHFSTAISEHNVQYSEVLSSASPSLL